MTFTNIKSICIIKCNKYFKTNSKLPSSINHKLFESGSNKSIFCCWLSRNHKHYLHFLLNNSEYSSISLASIAIYW